jgi:hypothetical protein
MAMAAAGNGHRKRALLLAGAVAALWESLGISLSIAFWDVLLEREVTPPGCAGRGPARELARRPSAYSVFPAHGRLRQKSSNR